MLTTNDIKVKERLPSPEDEEQVKLTIISSNKVKPKDFALKGKGAPPSDDIITTSNVKIYRERYEKEMEKLKKKEK